MVWFLNHQQYDTCLYIYIGIITLLLPQTPREDHWVFFAEERDTVYWGWNHRIIPVTSVQSSKDPTKNRIREANDSVYFRPFIEAVTPFTTWFCSSIPNFRVQEILTECTDLPKKTTSNQRKLHKTQLPLDLSVSQRLWDRNGRRKVPSPPTSRLSSWESKGKFPATVWTPMTPRTTHPRKTQARIKSLFKGLIMDNA